MDAMALYATLAMPVLLAMTPGLLWYALVVTLDRPARVVLSGATRHLTLPECEAALAKNLRIIARFLRSIRRSHPFERRFTRNRRRFLAGRAHRALVMATVLAEHIAAYQGKPPPRYLRNRRRLWREAAKLSKSL